MNIETNTNTQMIVFNPIKNINKRDYTPNNISNKFFSSEYDKLTKKYINQSEYVEVKQEYNIAELIIFMIKENKLEDFNKLMLEFPYVLNPHVLNQNFISIEAPIFLTMTYENLDFFKYLKDINVDFFKLDFDYMNVYENAIYHPEFWVAVYDDLDQDELYQKITTTKSEVYRKGCFEFLFEGRENSLNCLKKFKEKYPEVLKKIINNNSDNPKIKYATGETLLIMHNYDVLAKDLTLNLNNLEIKKTKKILKF